jgi:hypothetical protein
MPVSAARPPRGARLHFSGYIIDVRQAGVRRQPVHWVICTCHDRMESYAATGHGYAAARRESVGNRWRDMLRVGLI